MSSTLELTKSLINRASVTPDDIGCQALMIDRLKRIGFMVQPLKFGEVDNFWAVRGDSGPVFAFAGHTDVVPAGVAACAIIIPSLRQAQPVGSRVQPALPHHPHASTLSTPLANAHHAPRPFLDLSLIPIPELT